MTRRDYYHDDMAPPANSLVVGTSVIAVDDEGRLLFQRRRDSGAWGLPGGGMDIGETIGQAAVREAREETGLAVELTGIVGVYSDPGHVFAYDDGEVRQQFSLCFAARIVGGVPTATDEAIEVRLVPRDEVRQIGLPPWILVRIDDFLEGRTPAIR